MATYYDALNDFFKRNEIKPLASSAQLVYLHLLQLNNRHGNSGHITISDRKLKEKTQLSRPTITEAKRTLKNVGLIDFDGGKHGQRQGTRYTLCIFLASDLGSDFASDFAGRENPNIHVRDKTEDLKTKDTSATATRARAPVNYDIDKLVDRWESSEAFGKLDMLIVSKLAALLKSYSVDEILSAMDKAVLCNDNRRGINYNYFEAILKGGERNVRVAQRPVNNRPNVLAFATGRTASNSGDISTGKGRFDDDEPDCSWLYEGNSDG